MSLLQANKVHFVGIGGAGMSAIAKILLERGIGVSGSDLKWSRAAAMLEALGAEVHVGHDAALVQGADVVVVSTAVPPSNPEYAAANDQSIPVIARGEALAAILEGTRSVVVAGTHGKTTTTSMVATILRHADLDPTYLIGAGLNDAGTNARSGSSDISVAESDESDASFLLLAPYIGVVTNVELDHVDRWGGLEELYDAFAAFMRSTAADGALVVPAGEQRLQRLATEAARRTITFGSAAEGDVTASDVEPEGLGSRFTLRAPGAQAETRLRVPGEHNVSNAVAAAAAAHALGVDLDAIAGGLAAYRGVERRFQIKGEADGVTVIDDYAHHPTEVRATLGAARPGPYRRLVALFQPHRYSRTAALAAEFGAAFEAADQVVLMDVYGAGEDPIPGVSGKLIADAVCRAFPGRRVAYFPHRDEVLAYLGGAARAGDAVLTMGAGDVTTIGDDLLARLGDR